jgi:hypothetical protein
VSRQLGLLTSNPLEEAAVEREYVGIDLHRRRSVIPGRARELRLAAFATSLTHDGRRAVLGTRYLGRPYPRASVDPS